MIVVIAVLGWLFVIAPARRQQRRLDGQHRAMQDSLEAGDEIITAGGLHAVVRELGEDQLRVEIAPGVLATLDRRAVAAVAREEEVEEEPESPEGGAEAS